MTKEKKSFRTHNFYKFWLKITAIVVGSFGPVFFLGSMEASMEPARWTLDLLSWPLDGSATYSSGDTRFLSALAGGFLMGWGATIWMLSTKVYDKAPEAIRQAVVIGVLFWFVFDTGGSIASGNPSNAFFNILVLLLAVGPMWVAVKE
ncbi:MAG: hypothetical protein MRZ79_22740 [Bacteroidia bacterium]|nr:hypothetical protein [Bacteroidia bacterium]